MNFTKNSSVFATAVAIAFTLGMATAHAQGLVPKRAKFKLPTVKSLGKKTFKAQIVAAKKKPIKYKRVTLKQVNAERKKSGAKTFKNLSAKVTIPAHGKVKAQTVTVRQYLATFNGWQKKAAQKGYDLTKTPMRAASVKINSAAMKSQVAKFNKAFKKDHANHAKDEVRFQQAQEAQEQTFRQ